MTETLIYGVLIAVLTLGPLIVLHEFGHYFLAKLNGVKVLEFGFGFPPRALGIWTGNTLIQTTAETIYRSGLERAQIKPGDMITIWCSEDDDDGIAAATVKRFERQDLADVGSEELVYVGKVRSIDAESLSISDMKWSINWLPFGGFVKLRGEENPKAADSLAAKSPVARISVIVAGVIVNAILPFIIFMVVVLIPVQYVAGDVVVANVFPNSPAYEAGIRPLQKIVSVDGKPITSFGDLQNAVTIALGTETVWEVQRGIPNPFARPTEPQVQYIEGDTQLVSVIPRWDPPRHEVVQVVDNPASQFRLGEARVYDRRVGVNDRLTVVEDGAVNNDLNEIAVSDARDYIPTVEVGDTIPVTDSLEEFGILFTEARKFNNDLGSVTHLQEGAAGVQLQLVNTRTESRSTPLLQVIPAGIERTFDTMFLAKNAIVSAISGSNNPQFEGPLAVGPVGLSQLSGEVVTAEIPATSRVAIVLTLAATLSMSLAVINLLPFPGLDGGRLAFTVVEILRGGKKISPQKEGIVHLAGFILLITLIIVISFSDIARLIGGERFL